MSHALVIGAGPAGLMAADVISSAGYRVTIADQMPSVGRKFLMAGKSGLNLTKAEPLDAFLQAYGDTSADFIDAVRLFGPEAVQDWARHLGQSIFTGSTGRVFPTVMKASPLLRAWLARLDLAGCTLRTRWRWQGWDGEVPTFATPEGPQRISVKATVLALGGGSWARLGSDGKWTRHLNGTTPFRPANCGFHVPWTSHMAPFFGHPVKATRLIAGDRHSRGEWVVTKNGIEGGGVYEVSAAIRDGAGLVVDLIPDLTREVIAERVARTGRKSSRKTILRKVLRLPPIKIALMNEFGRKAQMDIAAVAKALPVGCLHPFPMDDAISTAGGLRLDEMTHDFMIRDRPGVFAAGEMLDWEAPTGGYLITACLASGRAAGLGAVRWLATQN